MGVQSGEVGGQIDLVGGGGALSDQVWGAVKFVSNHIPDAEACVIRLTVKGLNRRSAQEGTTCLRVRAPSGSFDHASLPDIQQATFTSRVGGLLRDSQVSAIYVSKSPTWA